VLACTIALLISFASADGVGAEPIQPLPSHVTIENHDKVELGRLLFSERKLSKDNTISCAFCHDLNRGGIDHLPVSIGIGGASGDTNAPTVFNSGLNFRQFWNGRAKSLEEQVSGPIAHPKEMGSNWEEIVSRLKADNAYNGKFAAVYNDGVTAANVADAIASFERVLVTPNARFDRYLRGDVSAINAKEKLGYQKFKSYGCVSCHQGENVGGNMYQTMGVMGDYFKDRKEPLRNSDMGRFLVTGRPEDMHVFRVPSLRNVASTAPYFHDGTIPTLEAAVDTMARYQLGRKMSKDDIDAIVSFLKTLTGEQPEILGGHKGQK